MTHSARICVFTILAIAASAATQVASAQGGSTVPMCEAPVTKSYKVQPGFCPRYLVAMVSQGVESDGSCCCAPYGVPPIFAAGNYVMVRQTTEGHERVAKFLEDLGAYVPVKTIRELPVGN